MARTEKPLDKELSFRSFTVDTGTLDDASRAINGIAATEQPVLMPDWDRMEMVPEVLLMSGAKFPSDRTVPLLNNHNRFDAESVIGSASELRTEDGKMLTRAVFSSTAEGIFTRVKEKHLRDLSVGYKVDKRKFVPANTTERIAGREFTGPANVVTSWTVREVSVTPIGADDQAKLRGLPANPFTERTEAMLTKEQRAKLVARGMKEDLDDAAAIAWSIDNPEVRTVEKIVEKTTEKEPQRTDSVDKALAAFEERLQKKILEREEAARKLTAYIRSECQRHGIDDVQSVIDASADERAADKKILELLADRTKNPPARSFIVHGKDQTDKHSDALRSAFMYRALSNCKTSAETVDKALPKDQRAAGWEDFRYYSLLDFARESLELQGYNLRGLTKESIAIAALGGANAVGLRSAGFHVTAAFPNLVKDAINKSMLIGYEERPFTWRQVFRQAASVPDFKNIYRVRMSEAPNLTIWPDNTKPEEVAFTDYKEQYAVESYANVASFSWKLMVNDDMDALSRIPQLLGNAAARTVNAAVWSIVTSNPNLQDGQALFSAATGNRKKTNLTTGAITVAALGTARSIMRLQVGANTKMGNTSAAILNLTPRYLVVPAAIETTATQAVYSAFDPADNKTNVYNPFSRQLEVVTEPLLDASSAIIWYLVADSSQIDTIEVSFLQGQESPVTRQTVDDDTWSLKHMIVQTFAAKALDFRGFVRSSGT